MFAACFAWSLIYLHQKVNQKKKEYMCRWFKKVPHTRYTLFHCSGHTRIIRFSVAPCRCKERFMVSCCDIHLVVPPVVSGRTLPHLCPRSVIFGQLFFSGCFIPSWVLNIFFAFFFFFSLAKYFIHWAMGEARLDIMLPIILVFFCLSDK